ncbi:MAG: hypothetical protein K0U29_07040 [Gammaproteobacteria bacterium]|nr:hypothetical protein [Gammaproteobacteria bacterium]MCH9744670.1 hypothetical protein [Gammaproteobacteria bacterium]
MSNAKFIATAVTASALLLNVAGASAQSTTTQPDSVDVKCTTIAKDKNGKVVGQRSFHHQTKGRIVGSVLVPTGARARAYLLNTGIFNTIVHEPTPMGR